MSDERGETIVRNPVLPSAIENKIFEDITDFPPGLILVPTAETARYAMFTQSIAGLQVPPGSAQLFSFSAYIYQNCNDGCEQLLAEGNEELEWIWFLGDDHSFFEPTLLMMLVSMYSADLDVLVPLTLTREYPPQTVLFMDLPKKGEKWKRVSLRQFDEPGVVEVAAAGSGGMLVRRRVIEKIDRPWFTPCPMRNGEDVNFCLNVGKHGFKIHADLRIPFGHITAVTLWPRWDHEGRRWMYLLDHGGMTGPWLAP